MKLKICSECGREGFLFRASPKLCQACARKYHKPVNKISEKRAVQNKEYKVLREEYLKEHPSCQAKLIGCTFEATQIHHKYSGKDRAEHYLDVNTWLSICYTCHQKLHDVLSSDEVKKLNLKL